MHPVHPEPRLTSLAWGWAGARQAAERNDIVVIVDVLRFSTAVCAAASRGAWVRATGKHMGSGASLSPGDLLGLAVGEKFELASLNGSECVRLASTAPLLLIGCLNNASAAGALAARLSLERGLNVTVVACGERTANAPEDGELRFAEEDYLGAGSILAAMDLEKSAAAEMASLTFSACRPRLPSILLGCPSGVELVERGLSGDVSVASALDSVEVVPVLKERWLQPYTIRAPQV